MNIEINGDNILFEWTEYKDGREYCLAQSYKGQCENQASDFYVYVWNAKMVEWELSRELGILEALLLENTFKEGRRREKVADTLKNFRQLLKQPFGEE